MNQAPAMTDGRTKIILDQVNQGDIVEASFNGQIRRVEFGRLKDKNFVGKALDDGKHYNIPCSFYVRILEKAPKVQGDYKALKPGDLFCIKSNKNDLLIFKFEGLSTRSKKEIIIGINPVTGITTTIDAPMFYKKLSEL